jgi:pyruvate dehydrogenase (quinone)/pyruvate oxidase
MARTAAELLVDRLIDWGVSVIFGLPGDGINGIMEALRQRQDEIRFIQVRHEESAAFMACGYAKYTGKLGVCLATSGPGAIHLLNGLYDAKNDFAPVLAITGHTYHDLIGTHYQQDVNVVGLYGDVALYNNQITGAQHVIAVTDMACRKALSERGVSHLNFPVDLQEQTLSDDEKSMMKAGEHTSSAWTRPVLVPSDTQIAAAAELLNAEGKTAILCGQGALGCGDLLEELAEKLGAPIIKALLGKAVLPDDSPYTTGGIGLLGTLPSELAMEECDSLLIVGSNMPYSTYYPEAGKARAVQIDCNPANIGWRYPVDIGLAGDARATLERLLPKISKRADRSFLETAQMRMTDWRETEASRGQRDDVPLKPQTVVRTLSDMIDDNAVISADCGTNTFWAARGIVIKRAQKFSCSGTLATMACGLPYAIAAAVAFPDRQSVAIVGDGGFTMLMGEFATAVKYNLPLKIVILKNNSLGQIKWEQMVFLGNPEYGCELEPIDFVKFAEACGGSGIRCEKPEDIVPAFESMLSETDGPAIVEAIVDQYEPPLPPRISAKQAVHFGEALARGEPNGSRIALTVFRDKWKEYVGG